MFLAVPSYYEKNEKKLKKERFEKMIVFMGWENVGRTNNQVERNNRSIPNAAKNAI